jgi:hypothetical protein
MLYTTAQKRHFARAFAALAAYVATFRLAEAYVRHHHPGGIALYVCAALPWVMMCGVIASIGLYIHEERDGYSRDVAMRTMLWGAGAAMAVNLFVWFLHLYGWKGQAPGFLEICVFGGAAAVANIAYGIKNRPEC